MTVLSWKVLPRNLRLPLVARVSLGVDATDAGAIFTDFNFVLTEIWFKRGGVVENQPPQISVSDNQTVAPGKTVCLSATVIDPNQDPTTVTWSQLATSTTPSVRLNGASSTRASFVPPIKRQRCSFNAVPRVRSPRPSVLERRSMSGRPIKKFLPPMTTPYPR